MWNADENDVAQLLRDIRDELRALRESQSNSYAYDPAEAMKGDKELLEKALEGSEAEKQGFKAK